MALPPPVQPAVNTASQHIQASPPEEDRGTTNPGDPDKAVVEAELLIEDDLLIEDVSIDGMCGVY